MPTALKRIRYERGFTQRDLSAALNVTQCAVWTWETGKSRPRPAMGKRLAEHLGVGIETLLAPDVEKATGVAADGL